MRSHSTNLAPLFVGDMKVEDFKTIFSKLPLSACVEALVSDYLFDRYCDYHTCCSVLKRAMQAYAEVQLADHGIGLAAEATLLAPK